MDKYDATSSVKPIRFRMLDGDHFESSTVKSSQECSNGLEEFQSNAAKLAGAKMQENFSFEYSYPAVVFNQVCFSVDRSSQQANFLFECLDKLKHITSFRGQSKEERQVQILKSVNLNVPYGSIFGLLGPSSCGKTTLLRCLVGLLEPSSGSIRLLCKSSQDLMKSKLADKSSDLCCGSGSKPGRSSDCRIPGANVGYMPQDIGLYEDFTIRQLLTMFGQYVQMNAELIVSRIQFMAKFLDLPDIDRQILSLSGGQKRRVSFAIACLHMPPLIILDEPTVGVDPMLRQSIWKYLRRLADEENKTIIITTHYIEEAAQADQVALMRAGEILVQDSPKRIMESNGCKSLEEAFLKICNNVQRKSSQLQAQPTWEEATKQSRKLKLYPQSRFNWHQELPASQSVRNNAPVISTKFPANSINRQPETDGDLLVRELRAREENKLALYDELKRKLRQNINNNNDNLMKLERRLSSGSMSVAPSGAPEAISRQPLPSDNTTNPSAANLWIVKNRQAKANSARQSSLRGAKLVIYESYRRKRSFDELETTKEHKSSLQSLAKHLTLAYALLYKNYRRNINSLPLLAFQFLLPVVQMISFSLCVGGRPTDIGLGLVNFDQPYRMVAEGPLYASNPSQPTDDDYDLGQELMSERYLSFIDRSMLSIKNYSTLNDALNDVRRNKLWAVMVIGDNFTESILRRFDLENFYQLDSDTIQKSVIKLYPDRSNKVLDMICLRSLMSSYRKFLLDQFEHFKRLPVEVKEPVFDIKPNIISNSIDGYTESIAAGLLASLTYIMAAGLTTFIMVVERSAGILERTYTSGINPIAYLLAHAIFRSFVMMAQIAVVMFLTFSILQQPLVGSIWLAYLMLMTLNLTGIAYGLLISSLVTDQNGAALTIVSSLVVKITMSGILWPFEAIPRWLRFFCTIQPLTMPVQALKVITLKGGGLADRTVQMGFLVSIVWLSVFLTISARRFRFYQH